MDNMARNSIYSSVVNKLRDINKEALTCSIDQNDLRPPPEPYIRKPDKPSDHEIMLVIVFKA